MPASGFALLLVVVVIIFNGKSRYGKSYRRGELRRHLPNPNALVVRKDILVMRAVKLCSNKILSSSLGGVGVPGTTG